METNDFNSNVTGNNVVDMTTDLSNGVYEPPANIGMSDGTKAGIILGIGTALGIGASWLYNKLKNRKKDDGIIQLKRRRKDQEEDIDDEDPEEEEETSESEPQKSKKK